MTMANGHHDPGVGRFLKRGRLIHKRECAPDCLLIERVIREEIEVDRFTMPMPQGEGGPAIKSESRFSRDAPEVRPKVFLLFGQDTHHGFETGAHAKRRVGNGGTASTSASPRR